MKDPQVSVRHPALANDQPEPPPDFPTRPFIPDASTLSRSAPCLARETPAPTVVTGPLGGVTDPTVTTLPLPDPVTHLRSPSWLGSRRDAWRTWSRTCRRSRLGWRTCWQTCWRRGFQAWRSGWSEEYCQPRHGRWRDQSQVHRVKGGLLWLATIASLTGSIGQPLLNQPRYGIGAIAPIDMRAPYDAVVLDRETTANRQDEARTGTVPVLKIDPAVDQELTADLERLLTRGDRARALVGPLPFLPTGLFAVELQQEMRSVPEPTWQAILKNATQPRPSLDLGHHLAPGAKSGPAQSDHTAAEPNPQASLILALHASHRRRSPAAWRSLIQEIEQARHRYQLACTSLVSPGQAELDVQSYCQALALSPIEWQQTRAATQQALLRILAQGVAPGLPQSLVARAAALHLSPLVPLASRSLAIDLLVSVLRKPNLVHDPEQTKERAERAVKAADPVRVARKAGEPIVRAGDRITPEQFALLDRYGLSQRQTNWLGLGQLALVATAGTLIFWQINRRQPNPLRLRDHLLLGLLSLSLPLTLTLGTGLPPGLAGAANTLPAIGLLAGSFYGSTIGTAIVGLLTLTLPLGLEVEWRFWVAAAAGGLVAGALAGRRRSREELAWLGVWVAIGQGTVYLVTSLMASAAASSVWLAVLGAALLQGGAGLIWCVLALGLSPYLEHLFDLITPIRLAELANLNRPLLRRLAAEAPGTFQHVLFVSSLAEAAARALKCNVELVRAGTLYHDIGKLHAPEFFIENQMGNPNPHDALNNPWQSADIVKKHVTEGLVMARQARLPRAIQAFIPEHQGTIAIAYFYYQAKQREAECITRPSVTPAPLAAQGGRSTLTVTTCPLVNEADFRYPGPIPQSRETGLVMLADACEAALRSLDNATYDDALAMVNRIIRARWQEGQLVDSGLSREDLQVAAEVFVKVWQQCNHRRIAYPKGALPR